MDALAFEHHLTSPQGTGTCPGDGFTVTAGGGSCCDQITLLGRDRRRRASPTRASTPTAAAPRPPPAAPRSTLVRGAPLLDAARIGPRRDRRRARRAEPGQAARGRARRRRARPGARGGGPRARAQLAAPPGAADAGGDERRRRQRRRGAPASRAGGEAVAVTLELWADPENDAERSCCSASAVAQARALAHSMGLPHFTLDLRDEFRAGVVEPFIAGYAARRDPEPVRRLQRPRAPRRDARARRPARLRGRWPPATTRAWPRPATRAGRCCAPPPTRPRTRPTCSPRWRRRRWRGCASRSASCTSREVRAHRRRGRAAGRRQGRLPGPLLPGRHRPGAVPRAPRRRSATGPGRSSTAAARCSARHLGQHRFTVGQRRGLGVGRGEPLYVLDKDAVEPNG